MRLPSNATAAPTPTSKANVVLPNQLTLGKRRVNSIKTNKIGTNQMTESAPVGLA